MALTAQLINPSYSYQKDGVVSFSVTLELSENAVVVATTGLSTTTAFVVDDGNGGQVYNPTWDDKIKTDIKAQADAYIAQYKFLMQLVNIKYPTAVIPQDAVAELTSAIVLEV